MEQTNANHKPDFHTKKYFQQHQPMMFLTDQNIDLNKKPNTSGA